MKKVYVLFPVIAMLIFFGIWWNYNAKYEAAKAEKARLAREARDAKLIAEAEERKLAIQMAVAAAEARKQERDAKNAQQQAEKEARQQAKEASDKAYRDKEKLARQKERLIKDVETERETIAKLEERKGILLSEETFLRQYVRMAESNQQGLQHVMEKINAADVARAKAEADAAASRKR
ncbi:MAG: hypothetical protein H3C27_00325 [Opitutaceae bacterium]|nr:hypothetical protein [Opitutaceae bacterium]